MAKRRYKTTKESIERRIKQGRGQGKGANYMPWLTIQDVPSLGLVQRIKGLKTGRVHHFLSQLEARYFFILEWSPQVIDIREQYPLFPQEMTLKLACQSGVSHPVHPQTRYPVVMTTDFLITLQGTHRPMVVARTVKPTSELNKRRVQEKFEIERRYWLKRGIDWGIVTEQDIDTTLAQNLQLLRQYWDVSNRLNGNSERLAEIVKELNLIASNNSDQSLRTMTRLCGQRLNLPAGDCLAVIYHLLITRQWQANLRMPLNPTKPITSLETKENKDA